MKSFFYIFMFVQFVMEDLKVVLEEVSVVSFFYIVLIFYICFVLILGIYSKELCVYVIYQRSLDYVYNVMLKNWILFQFFDILLFGYELEGMYYVLRLIMLILCFKIVWIYVLFQLISICVVVDRVDQLLGVCCRFRLLLNGDFFNLEIFMFLKYKMWFSLFCYC